MLLSWETRLFAAVIVAVCAFALWKGGQVERRGAVLFLASWLGSAAAQAISGVFTPVFSLFIIDAALFVALAALAWKSRRSWPAVAAGLQAIALAAHVAFLLGVVTRSSAYLTVLVGASYVMLLALLIGALRQWREGRSKEGLHS